MLTGNGPIYNKLNCVLSRRIEGESVTSNNWSPISTNKKEEDFEQIPTPLAREKNTNDVQLVVYNLQDDVNQKI